MELWIDSKGFVRRLVVDETPLMSTAFDMLLGSVFESVGQDWREMLVQPGGELVLFRTVTDFSDFGVDIVVVEAPPEQLIVGDVDSLKFIPQLTPDITAPEILGTEPTA